MPFSSSIVRIALARRNPRHNHDRAIELRSVCTNSHIDCQCPGIARRRPVAGFEGPAPAAFEGVSVIISGDCIALFVRPQETAELVLGYEFQISVFELASRGIDAIDLSLCFPGDRQQVFDYVAQNLVCL